MYRSWHVSQLQRLPVATVVDDGISGTVGVRPSFVPANDSTPHVT